ncbi:class II fumarate hydratase [Candidatus Deferrimicrobium sp.]|uniref:class II fumarate hydratase n=1 Tax=Candidatus Deferrimicrobium sp. TaxID=3060586 RepID=UPI0039C8AB89
MMATYRVERDSMGEVRVPAKAYYGAQSQRAVDNFPVSGQRMPMPVVYAVALVKGLAAEVNAGLGVLPPPLGEAISRAAREVLEGKFDDQFVVDVFQTGSGTSTNMNVNEVLANRANELLGKPLGGNAPVHPNDHVNRCQSSNDVIPSAIRIAARRELSDRLLPALVALRDALSGKAEEFSDVLKIGRTHLQDAVPVTLGQEFSGYASQIDHGIRRVRATFADLEELPLGGTAVGTGLNAHPEFAARTIAEVAGATGIPFRPAENRFEAMGAQDPLVAASGALKGVAASLMKIAHDLRILSSGPRCGIGEISLPSLQPGSSIMPGKVNPVILEVVIQVAAQTIGNDATVTVGGGLGVLELNVMQPVMARNLLESVGLLSSSTTMLASRCVAGIAPNRARCAELIEQSLAMVTPLAVRIGYDKAAELAHEAYHTGKTIRELLTEKGGLTADEIDRILDPRTMI